LICAHDAALRLEDDHGSRARAGDELEGGDVLPGFRPSVKDLFNKAGEPA
jgi:hypothetical protein